MSVTKFIRGKLTKHEFFLYFILFIRILINDMENAEKPYFRVLLNKDTKNE